MIEFDLGSPDAGLIISPRLRRVIRPRRRRGKLRKLGTIPLRWNSRHSSSASFSTASGGRAGQLTLGDKPPDRKSAESSSHLVRHFRHGAPRAISLTPGRAPWLHRCCTGNDRLWGRGGNLVFRQFQYLENKSIGTLDSSTGSAGDFGEKITSGDR